MVLSKLKSLMVGITVLVRVDISAKTSAFSARSFRCCRMASAFFVIAKRNFCRVSRASGTERASDSRSFRSTSRSFATLSVSSRLSARFTMAMSSFIAFISFLCNRCLMKFDLFSTAHTLRSAAVIPASNSSSVASMSASHLLIIAHAFECLLSTFESTCCSQMRHTVFVAVATFRLGRFFMPTCACACAATAENVPEECASDRNDASVSSFRDAAGSVAQSCANTPLSSDLDDNESFNTTPESSEKVCANESESSKRIFVRRRPPPSPAGTTSVASISLLRSHTFLVFDNGVTRSVPQRCFEN
eukprot:Opistho-2@21871